MYFEAGQIFENTYPPEAAQWCNDSKAYIEEIEKLNGVRRFRIVGIPEPTQEEVNAQTQASLTSAVQKVLDTEAQKLGYDSCLSVCSYVETGVQKFDDEGKAFRAWRSAVWAKGYEILNAVLTGEREVPTEEQLLAELPALAIAYSEGQ